MQRRTLLQILATAGASLRFLRSSFAQVRELTPAHVSTLRALADVVLPTELGPARAAVVDDFLRWIGDYREGAEMDHGYGFTRLRRTAASPAPKYPAQLAALERAARAHGPSFERLNPDRRRQVVEQAIAAVKIDRLPLRPTGDHVAVDLMAFYFQSGAANDLAYRAAIGRDNCRGLQGSNARPRSGA